MFPVSELSSIDLKKAGLRMNQSDIFDANKTSLSDALVKVGGCTGSFVSDEGLIITNHHCAFGAVSAVSTAKNDYLTDGFLAKTKEEEIPAKGLTCRITESYEDVSDRVLEFTSTITDPVKRLEQIETNIRSIEKEERAKNPGKTIEISEMFTGRTYFLFRYQTLSDVRLVYIPRRAIGEFGGESDNWIWPRHTGDYSFLRAYVSPDGTPSAYNENNIPYTPKKHLKINSSGVEDGDFVFVLGYPGRTFRNQPASFLNYQEKYQLPYISDLYEWQNKTMYRISEGNKTLELSLASRIKGNANTLKNYKGKIKGMRQLAMTAERANQEIALQKFIDSNKKTKEKYGSVITEIDSIYGEKENTAELDMWYSQVMRSCRSLYAAYLINRLKELVLAEDSVQNQLIVFERNKGRYGNFITNYLKSSNTEVEKAILKKMMTDAFSFTEANRVNYIDKNQLTDETLDKWTEKQFKKTKFTEIASVEAIFALDVKDFVKIKDPLVTLARDLAVQLEEIEARQRIEEGALNSLLAKYVDAKMEFQNKGFLPDANSTLRLTFGNIKGYSPGDGAYYEPITTLTGLIEKGESTGDYELPQDIVKAYVAKDFGQFNYAKKDNVPVCILYDTDTSGGNSGSPVLDADGNLVGVNFDRAYKATINDYAWDPGYSRSIGVDIRYVLWVASKIDKADNVLKELKVYK